MKKMNPGMRAFALTVAALMLLCGLVFAETVSVAKMEAKYGFEIITKGDEVTFEKGDTLKAVATDPVKLGTWLKPPAPAKGDKLTMIYLGDGSFQVQWVPAGKAMRVILRCGDLEM